MFGMSASGSESVSVSEFESSCGCDCASVVVSIEGEILAVEDWGMLDFGEVLERSSDEEGSGLRGEDLIGLVGGSDGDADDCDLIAGLPVSVFSTFFISVSVLESLSLLVSESSSCTGSD